MANIERCGPERLSYVDLCAYQLSDGRVMVCLDEPGHRIAEYVPASQLRGAVDLLRELSERWADVRVSGNAARVAALGDAMQRARDLTGGQ
jgi:hypothetical protein